MNTKNPIKNPNGSIDPVAADQPAIDAALPAKPPIIIFGKVKADSSLTDKTLIKNLKKEGHELTEDMFNKTLLDLEILGLINVSWVAKDTRKIEIASKYEEDDEVELQNKEALKNDYEASFPGTENQV